MDLDGKQGLVVGVANDQSIAWGCARVFRAQGAELGSAGIRVNALSPGPVKTRAASGLKDFDDLMHQAVLKAPLHQQLTAEQIGETAAFLVSDRAAQVSGQVIYVDNGYNILG